MIASLGCISGARRGMVWCGVYLFLGGGDDYALTKEDFLDADAKCFMGDEDKDTYINIR